MERQQEMRTRWLADRDDVCYVPEMSLEYLGISGYSGAHLEHGLGKMPWIPFTQTRARTQEHLLCPCVPHSSTLLCMLDFFLRRTTCSLRALCLYTLRAKSLRGQRLHTYLYIVDVLCKCIVSRR